MVSKITTLLVALSVMMLIVQAQDSKGAGSNCGINEYHTECYTGGCTDRRCFENGKDVVCISICRGGCYCVLGTARNTTGSCVPVNECA